MLTSIRREIPNNSITGEKILDGTNISHVGDLTAKLLGVVDLDGTPHIAAGIGHAGDTIDNAGLIYVKGTDGNNKVLLDGGDVTFSFIDRIIVFGGNSLIDDYAAYRTQVSGGLSVSSDIKCLDGFRVTTSGGLLRVLLDNNAGNGRFALRDNGNVTKVLLDSASDCYINRSIVLGSNSFPFSSVTYPVQVQGNFGVAGTGYFTGGITNLGQTDTLGLRVNSVVVDSTKLAYLNTMNQNVATSSTPTFADATIGVTLLSALITASTNHSTAYNAHGMSIEEYGGVSTYTGAQGGGTWSVDYVGSRFFKYRRLGTIENSMLYMYLRLEAPLTGGNANYLIHLFSVAIGAGARLRFKIPIVIIIDGVPEMGYALGGTEVDQVRFYRLSLAPFVSGTTIFIEYNILASAHA